MRYTGVQPYVIWDGQVHLILGWDTRNIGYSSFGGKPESSQYQAEAIREFYEESMGLFETDYVDFMSKLEAPIQVDNAVTYPLRLSLDRCSFRALADSFNRMYRYAVRGILPDLNSSRDPRDPMDHPIGPARVPSRNLLLPVREGWYEVSELVAVPIDRVADLMLRPAYRQALPQLEAWFRDHYP